MARNGAAVPDSATPADGAASSGRPAARPGKGERTRARILDAAAALFAESGYRAVSLRAIASRSGLTHAGVLHHFADKEATLMALLSRRDEIDRPRVVASGLDAREVLGHLLAIAERNASTPHLVALYVNLSAEACDAEHPAHAYFKQRYRTVREALARALDELLPRDPRPVPADTAARQLIALQDGLQVQWLIEPDQVDIRAELLAYVRSLGIEPAAVPAAPDALEPRGPGA